MMITHIHICTSIFVGTLIDILHFLATSPTLALIEYYPYLLKQDLKLKQHFEGLSLSQDHFLRMSIPLWFKTQTGCHKYTHTADTNICTN